MCIGTLYDILCVCKAWKKLLCTRILKSEDDINQSGNVHFLTFIHRQQTDNTQKNNSMLAPTEIKHRKGYAENILLIFQV